VLKNGDAKLQGGMRLADLAVFFDGSDSVSRCRHIGRVSLHAESAAVVSGWPGCRMPKFGGTGKSRGGPFRCLKGDKALFDPNEHIGKVF
jgi:hypothetical protein